MLKLYNMICCDIPGDSVTHFPKGHLLILSELKVRSTSSIGVVIFVHGTGDTSLFSTFFKALRGSKRSSQANYISDSLASALLVKYALKPGAVVVPKIWVAKTCWKYSFSLPYVILAKFIRFVSELVQGWYLRCKYPGTSFKYHGSFWVSYWNIFAELHHQSANVKIVSTETSRHKALKSAGFEL